MTKTGHALVHVLAKWIENRWRDENVRREGQRSLVPLRGIHAKAFSDGKLGLKGARLHHEARELSHAIRASTGNRDLSKSLQAILSRN